MIGVTARNGTQKKKIRKETQNTMRKWRPNVIDSISQRFSLILTVFPGELKSSLVIQTHVGNLTT